MHLSTKFLCDPTHSGLCVTSSISPQTPVAMSSSGRRVLPREELEVHHVLSPASGSRLNDTPAPAQRPRQPQVLSLGDLASLIRDSVVTGIKDGLALSAPDRQLKRKRSASPVAPLELIDDDLPDFGVEAVSDDEFAPPAHVFGADVNEEPFYEALSEEDQDPDHTFAPGQVPPRSPAPTQQLSAPAVAVPAVSVPAALASPVVAAPVIDDEPDADLPSVHPRLPATWLPKKKIVNWLEKAADREWSQEDRKKLVEKYHPEEKCDAIFLPVKMPTKLYKAFKSPATKKRDYLLNRIEVEKNLFYASSDLCTALRPLVEALSLLDDKEDCGHIKHVVGLGLMGVFSANVRISRGRRELGRRFVRLDCAEALFGVPPSHGSLFGGSSVSEALKKAQETSKLDDSLVYASKAKKPFRPAYNYYKDFQQGSRYKGAGRKNQYYRQPYNSYNSQYRSPQKSRYRNQSNKGQGRGGKRGSKASSKKTSS